MAFLPNNQFKQQGIAQVLLLLFILTGIGLGTVLIQQQTNFLPHADCRDGCYDGDRESEPEHGGDNTAGDNGGGGGGDNNGGDSGGGGGGGGDGSTFSNQSDETKKAFEAAYGKEGAEAAWNAEHQQELITGHTKDGRPIVDGKPVDKDWNNDGKIDVKDASQQVQQARENQAAIGAALAERNAAEQKLQDALARGDVSAAVQASAEKLAAEQRINELGGSYAQAEARTLAKEGSFDKAVEKAMASNIPDSEIGAVIGYTAALYGQTPEQAAQRAAQAIANRERYTSSDIGGAAGMASLAAGGTPDQAMSNAANAVFNEHKGDSSHVLSAAIATGNALELSDAEIEKNVREIGKSKGYTDTEIEAVLSALPKQTGTSSPARNDELAQTPNKVVIDNTAQAAPGPAPLPPKVGPPPIKATAEITLSSTGGSAQPKGVLDGGVDKGSKQTVQDFAVKAGETVEARVSVSVYNSKNDDFDKVTIIISDPDGGNGRPTTTNNILSVADSDGIIDEKKVKQFYKDNK